MKINKDIGTKPHLKKKNWSFRAGNRLELGGGGAVSEGFFFWFPRSRLVRPRFRCGWPQWHRRCCRQFRVAVAVRRSSAWLGNCGTSSRAAPKFVDSITRSFIRLNETGFFPRTIVVFIRSACLLRLNAIRDRLLANETRAFHYRLRRRATFCQTQLEVVRHRRQQQVQTAGRLAQNVLQHLHQIQSELEFRYWFNRFTE